MNRKLRKFLRDPGRFLRDSRLFGGRVATEELAPTVAALPPAPAAAPEPVVEAVPAPAIVPKEALARIGQNWLDATARPIAVLWGFEDGQRDVVARYLLDDRAAFVNAGTPWAALEATLDDLQGIRFIVWRHAEDDAVRAYAGRRGIAIARMDDGFIRSVARDAEPSGPYSLVLDTDAPGLERLLGQHDFSASQALLKAVPALMRLQRDLGIGKYSPGSLASAAHVLGPKLARRILVVGEKPHADAWTARRLVELAVADHPGAEVLYRPHPDAARKYRKGSAAAAELSTLCRVVTDSIALPELLRSVDHVYAEKSLAGMEALVHGLPVTVVGAPFYAGWGLTDDRQAIARPRRLELVELYCATYLLYPRYLADLDDPVTGCLATMLRIAAERGLRLDASITPELLERHAAKLALTDYWPALLKPENLVPLTAKLGTRLLRAFSIERALADSKAVRFQKSVACMVIGQFHVLPEAALYLRKVKASVRPDVYQQVLPDLWRMHPSAEVLEQMAWCREQAGDVDEARALLERLAFGGAYEREADSPLPFAEANHPMVLRLAQFELGQKKFERAEQLFHWLLLSGCLKADAFVGLADIARLRFDFTSAALLMAIARRLQPTWRQGRVHVQHAKACGLTGDAAGALESMAVACFTNPQWAGSVAAIQHVLERKIGALPYDEAMLMALELDESDNLLGRAKGLIAHERPADAERILLGHTPPSNKLVDYGLTLSRAYSYQGKLADAMAVISRMLATSPTLAVYQEGLRLAVLGNAYDWGQDLLDSARELQLEVSDVHERKILLGLGRIGESYRTFRKTRATGEFREYLGAKYVQSLDALNREPGGTNLVVAFYGPGDEIRFATFYREIQAAAGDARMVFTCDPRLLGLLSRHYTEIEFVPSARIRSLAWLEDFSAHDQLAGSDLHVFFDNSGWAAAKAADQVILVSDALGDVIDGYASFPGRSYLKADPARVRQWQDRLPRSRPGELLVGLSWRSSVMSYARNEHYLAMQDLLPLFEIEGIRFVNLQYDDCREELAWLEERLPGRLLHFDDLDQFNDLDGVAALMECLDLVVAPATTVVELAGALARPTFLLSNSSELHWRKIPGSRVDTWHRSIVHVEAPVLGDKAGLVRAAATELRQRLAAGQSAVQDVQALQVVAGSHAQPQKNPEDLT